MALPIILGVVAAVGGIGGIGSGAVGFVKTKNAKATMEDAKNLYERSIRSFESESTKTQEMMDELGKKEIKILSSFEKFSDVIEKIHSIPEFAQIERNGVEIPEYNPEELKRVSIGAGVLMAGLGGAVLGTAGSFAAAGATTAAVAALGTSSTGVSIATLSGAAATKATLAAIGGGAVAAGGGGIAAGAAILGTTAAGIGILVGGVIFSVVGCNLSKKADEAIYQAEKASEEIERINESLKEWYKYAKEYKNTLNYAFLKYGNYFRKLCDITKRTTDWNEFSNEEKLITENTVLMVSLLFRMCKVQLVISDESSESDENRNKLNSEDIEKSISDAKELMKKI